METSSTQQLTKYGIQNEHSDIRVHVCPLARRVYVFPTIEGRRAIEAGLGERRTARQPGVDGITADGRRISPFDIRRCVGVSVCREAWDAVNIRKTDNLSVLGEKAVRLVAGMIRFGLLPFPYPIGDVNIALEKDLEILGTDIIVQLKCGTLFFQIKCDFPGGEKALGGTGFLYIQTAERNPRRLGRT